jgi:hypothetical protein
MCGIWSQIVETLATFWARRAASDAIAPSRASDLERALALPPEVLPTSEPRISGEGQPGNSPPPR